MEDLSSCITNNSPASCALSSHTQGTAYCRLWVPTLENYQGRSKYISWDVGSGEKESYTYGDIDEPYNLQGMLYDTVSASITTLFTNANYIKSFWKRHTVDTANPIYLVNKYYGNNYETFYGKSFSAYKYAPIKIDLVDIKRLPQTESLAIQVRVQCKILWSD